MFHYVETPFRTRDRQRDRQMPFVASALTGSTAMLFAGFLIFGSGGWPQRIPASRLALASDRYEAEEIAACGPKVDVKALVTCSTEREAGKTVYVWGDSHAWHLIIGLSKTYPDFNIRILYFTGCRPQSGLFGYRYGYEDRAYYADACAKRNQDALAFFSRAQPTNIILHYFMSDGEIDFMPLTNATEKLVAALASFGHNVKLLGDVIRPNIYLPDCYSVPPIITDHRQSLHCHGDLTLASHLSAQNDRFAAIFGERFVNPAGAFLADGQYLTVVSDHLLFRDTNHLTPFGSTYFIGKVADGLAIR
jgi:hypothetical protein